MQYLLLLVIIINAVFYFRPAPEIIEMEKLPLSEPTAIELFMQIIAQIESGGNHKIVNSIGMLGKYQFSPTTIRGLGFNISHDEFLRNPALQDSVMIAYMKYNHTQLEDLIAEYEGSVRGDVVITRAGIIAAAHFAGTNGARQYLRSNRIYGASDIYGTTINTYMSHFSDFRLPSI